MQQHDILSCWHCHKQVKSSVVHVQDAKGGGDGFEVQKYGDGRVALIGGATCLIIRCHCRCLECNSHDQAHAMHAGFPSVGKSTLLSVLTGTHSEVAAYEFTTLTCIPGIIHYNEAKIQLLDLPGIIEGAAEGRGDLAFSCPPPAPRTSRYAT